MYNISTELYRVHTSTLILLQELISESEYCQVHILLKFEEVPISVYVENSKSLSVYYEIFDMKEFSFQHKEKYKMLLNKKKGICKMRILIDE